MEVRIRTGGQIRVRVRSELGHTFVMVEVRERKRSGVGGWSGFQFIKTYLQSLDQSHA